MSPLACASKFPLEILFSTIYLWFLVGFVRLQHVEMAMGMALQLCLNLSDATERLFTAGEEAFE